MFFANAMKNNVTKSKVSKVDIEKESKERINGAESVEYTI